MSLTLAWGLAITLLVAVPQVSASATPGSAFDGTTEDSFGTLSTSYPCGGSERIGILQDNVPWAAAGDQDPEGANVHEVKLQTDDFCVVTSGQLGSISLDSFDVLVISGAQTQTFYDNLFPAGTVHPDVESWVHAGGMMVAHLVDGASGPGNGGTLGG